MAAVLVGDTLRQAIADLLAGQTVKAALYASSLSFNKHTMLTTSALSGEVSGTGYAAGGVALTGVGVQLDTVNSRVELKADAANFGTITVTGIAQMVTYLATGSHAGLILSHHAWSPSVDVAAAGFTYQFAADGVDRLIGHHTY